MELWRWDNTANPTHTYSVAGSYTVSLTATGDGGSNTKTSSSFISVASSTAPPVTNSNGLVAAYGFEEIYGTTVADASGQGNKGTISNAARITTGKYGKALNFNGSNAWVTVNDSASLDLTTGMTLEAWVYPTSVMSSWRTILMKEQPSQQVYTLYANTDSNQAAMDPFINGGERIVSGGPQLTPGQWSHLAATYDGQNKRLYVNGIQVATEQQTGAILTSTGALRIGGDSIWGEYFNGYIDEVRIYNRALTSTEVLNDKATAISVSNPLQFVIGDANLEPWVDYSPQGVAEAFQTVPQRSSVVTIVQVYLDSSSTATQLVTGIYKDKNGHPGTRVAQGTLSTLKPGAWNSVSIPVASVNAGQPYWIAILGSKGQIKFRDRLGTGAGKMEISASSTLTSLPSTWTTGLVYSDGPISMYGRGY